MTAAALSLIQLQRRAIVPDISMELPFLMVGGRNHFHHMCNACAARLPSFEGEMSRSPRPRAGTGYLPETNPGEEPVIPDVHPSALCGI